MGHGVIQKEKSLYFTSGNFASYVGLYTFPRIKIENIYNYNRFTMNNKHVSFDGEIVRQSHFENDRQVRTRVSNIFVSHCHA